MMIPRSLLVCLLSLSQVSGFVVPALGAKSSHELSALPTAEQLSTEPFMKQVGYAAEIVEALDTTDQSDLTDLMKAQLSHSDGIRGFFVSFLTTGGGDPTKDLPPSLKEAMKTIEDRGDLVRLSIMNVVMPTGMVTLHTDAELQESSRKTALMGKSVLRELMVENKEVISSNCAAISLVCGDEPTREVDEKELEYWTEFCMKWGYQEDQRKDIAKAVAEFC